MRERVLGSRWMLSYFQILLGNCEANYVYSNFSDCFSCRITEQKIMETRMEKPLCFFFNSEQLGEGTGYSRRLLQAQTNPKRCSTSSPNTRTNPNIPQAPPFPKAPAGHTRGHLEDTGQGSLTHPHTLFRDTP